jgi:hypothetical protein
MPAKEDIEELKAELRKLSLRDRLKRLKEIEELRKAEMTDIEKLIKDSEKELKTEEVAEGITPKREEINIGKLFEEEGEQLERTIRKEAPEKDEEDFKYISFKQAYNDYSILHDITYASMEGELTPEHMETIDQIGERLDRTKYISASNEVADLLVASRAVLHKIKKYAGLK